MRKSVNDLAAFQRAMDLVVIVYDVTSRFPTAERFGLISQLRRAAIGIISQIAEGQGRLTYGEWRQFLSQARGSLYEVEAQLLAAERLGFIAAEELRTSMQSIQRTAAALGGLIRWVRARQPGNSATRQPT
jgi:four helix bundle protein